ncbi:PIN2/TERF1-interacting telomerase inhibitor 1-like [Anneissia japonica]|uniref:PIN2/TERF1-interacting telomerase inhibitor 1-like n=1 Tax=Anneissia japonica TaxID=1529436 RepID=UPI0014256A5E|nr:PIN2/TERF1-interacting telomerase inhibitor 1-like [Anneissia japonica]XP_033112906.1 PIN2/TERF1-interacting telomerase inhibitor 1-like [Anneissia japonica]
MAMLAEPRRRQKLSNDPRNTSWKNDSNKFGKRLMEKMGWTDGKGLGANEDGCQDHIKVSLKNNTRGLGCTVSHEDKWIAHQDDFNSLLANLNASHASGNTTPTETAVTSLEKRSKKSKKRVHYMKFTKGKDLTGYSSKDMDCIMGRRVSKSEPVTPQSQSTQNSDDSDTESITSCPDYGVQTITRKESVQEYFKKKMMLMQSAREGDSKERDDLSDQSDGCIPKASFKISQSDEEKDSSEVTVVKKKKKSKKRKHLEKEITEVCEAKEEEDQSVEKSSKKKKEHNSIQDISEDLPKKKKKKSKKSKNSIE